MKKDHLREPFELVLREFMDVCPRGQHTHSFFELVYIVAGSGTQVINGQRHPYREGDLFLLTPNDDHFFDIVQQSRFFFIRFNNGILHTGEDATIARRLEELLEIAREEPSCLLKEDRDREAVRRMIDLLIHEHLNEGLYQTALIRHLVESLLLLVARNITEAAAGKVGEGSDEKVLAILGYIQANIYFPDSLRASALAARFGMAEVYFGRYFKRHSGESLQQYIFQYKLKLIENRLLRSSMRVKEIADEFGFTDKSHLNRFFQKAKGLSPTAFRKRQHS